MICDEIYTQYLIIEQCKECGIKEKENLVNDIKRYVTNRTLTNYEKLLLNIKKQYEQDIKNHYERIEREDKWERFMKSKYFNNNEGAPGMFRNYNAFDISEGREPTYSEEDINDWIKKYGDGKI